MSYMALIYITWPLYFEAHCLHFLRRLKIQIAVSDRIDESLAEEARGACIHFAPPIAVVWMLLVATIELQNTVRQDSGKRRDSIANNLRDCGVN